MKRFLSTILVVIMLFSMMGTTGLTVYATEDYNAENNTINSGFNELRESLLGSNHKSEYSSDDAINSEKVENSATNSGYNELVNDIVDLPNYNEDTMNDFENSICESSKLNTCSHNRIKDYFSEDICQKYDTEKHILVGTFVVKCRECSEILEESKGQKKELHNFKEGKCKECGYKARNCKHEETENIVSYWYNSVNERGNDASYVEFDVVCTYCDVKIGTVVHYGPVTTIKASANCVHKNVEETLLSTCYEPSTEEKHYKLTKYIVKCLKCKEEFNNYTEEREEKHEIVDGKCLKCIYELPKTKITSKTANTTTSNKIVSNSTAKKSTQISETSTVKKVQVENLYINAKSKSYLLNEESTNWKNLPKEANGTLQVPLREFVKTMGWTVTWDSKKNIAYVTDGNVTKTFIPNSDVYLMKSTKQKQIGIELTNKCKIVDGILYADIEAILEGTEYAYYKSDTVYRVASRVDIIDRLTHDSLSGRNNLTTSERLYESEDYISVLEENRQIYVVQEGNSTYATVVVPAAEQGWYGNYYEGETTKEGIIARLIVGELPIAGTIADVRDVIYHLDKPEWTTEATIDVLAILPIGGLVKYLPKLSKFAKNADEAIEGIEIIADLSKNTDEVADIAKGTSKVTGTVVNAEDLVKSAEEAGNVIDSTKGTQKIADAAKASIKSVNDFQKLVTNPKIFAKDAIDHIFYGNSKGGLHYNGLSGSNGKITKITKAPNKYGVYEANVDILGKPKEKNTFFPDDWTPEEVIKAIEDAYTNGVYDSAKNIKTYTMKSGLEIQINLDRKTGEIVSAFPLY